MSHRPALIVIPFALLILAGGAWWLGVRLGGRAPEQLALPEKAEPSSESKERIRRLWDTYLAAESARRAGEAERAIALYQEVIRIEPNHEDALYALGNIYLDRDEYDQARQAYEQLLSVYPQSARAHYQLGVLHSTVEPGAPLDLERALEEFKRALAINPEESGPFVRLARLHAQMGNWTEAKSDAALALRRNPKSYEASHTLGLVALHDGAPAEAAVRFARSIELYRGDKPLGGVLGEGDTKATLGAFDLQDPRIVRDLFAVNAIGLATGSYPEQVPEWTRWKGAFLPPPARFLTSVTLPESGGRGAWVDVNEDGAPDLVVVDGSLSLLQNDGRGHLSAPRRLRPSEVTGDPTTPFAVIAGDVNRDRHQDLFVVGAGWARSGSDQLLISRSGGRFEDVTAQWGLDGERATAAATFADVNGDGLPDLVLGLSRPVRGRTLQLWLNTGTRFTPVEPAQLPDITTPVVGIVAADADGDRAAEILVSLWRAPSRLLHNDADRGLVDVTGHSGLACPAGVAATFVDFDRDGQLDVFCAGYPSNEQALRARFKAETPPDTPTARLFRRTSPGHFAETNGVIPALRAQVMQIATGDFNGDGWPDLYLACGGYGIDDFDPDIVLVNHGGKSFEERLPLASPEPGKSVGVAVSDVNHDGLADLYVARAGVLPGDKRAGLVLTGRAMNEQ